MKPYTITFEDFFQAQKLARTLKLWLILGTVSMLGAFFIGLVLSWVGLVRPIDPGQPATLGLIGVLFIFILGVSVFSQKRTYKKIYSSQKSFQEEITMTFDGEGVRWESVSGNYKVKWGDIHKYRENKNLILIYDGELLMRPVPKRVFENGEEKQFVSHLKKAMEER